MSPSSYSSAEPARAAGRVSPSFPHPPLAVTRRRTPLSPPLSPPLYPLSPSPLAPLCFPFFVASSSFDPHRNSQLFHCSNNLCFSSRSVERRVAVCSACARDIITDSSSLRRSTVNAFSCERAAIWQQLASNLKSSSFVLNFVCSLYLIDQSCFPVQRPSFLLLLLLSHNETIRSTANRSARFRDPSQSLTAWAQHQPRRTPPRACRSQRRQRRAWRTA